MAKSGSNPIANAVVFGVIGLLGIGLAVWLSTSVKCGPDTMGPADKCIESTDSGTRWLTYQEVQEGQQRQGLLFGGIGAVFLLGAAGTLVFGARNRRRQHEESAAAEAWTRAV
ncbi:hypothetical protein [Catellatospora sp. NPDC049133]|uniref:hypothetical protein n=1 Tax=Catellatospora sp. NPDC049133 TaxID=3155499 RepID=UPI0033E584E8